MHKYIYKYKDGLTNKSRVSKLQITFDKSLNNYNNKYI